MGVEPLGYTLFAEGVVAVETSGGAVVGFVGVEGLKAD